MDKLKTLKDMSGVCLCDECEPHDGTKYIDSSELKQEAINRIKYFRHNKNLNGFMVSMAFEFNIGDIEGEIGWIKYFFNITEEDLK